MKNSEKWAFLMSNPYLIQIQSHLSELNNVVKPILKFLNSFKIDESIVFDIRLCLEEALINAIKHGNKNNKDLPVKICYAISDNKFKMSIEDKGNGFNYKSVSDPTAKENLLKAKGRGVYLVKYLMDEVSFNKKGNKITMVKYLKQQIGGGHAGR